jgi:hypothetical protein
VLLLTGFCTKEFKLLQHAHYYPFCIPVGSRHFPLSLEVRSFQLSEVVGDAKLTSLQDNQEGTVEDSAGINHRAKQ